MEQYSILTWVLLYLLYVYMRVIYLFVLTI